VIGTWKCNQRVDIRNAPQKGWAHPDHSAYMTCNNANQGMNMPKAKLDSEVTPEQRRRAVATILARGVLCRLLVLCGHTQGGGELHVLPNLKVLTGEAEYGNPQIQQILELR
jgi:hypothetical protein